MNTALVAICGESDHPLLGIFKDYYKKVFNQVIVQMGVTEKWLKVNGNTAQGEVFEEKMQQQNAALKKVHKDTDYIFTFDVDEFISYADLQSIVWRLKGERPDCGEMQMNQFWHQDNYVAYGGRGWGFEAWNPRIFRYEKGMTFVNHRPPTTSYPMGKIMKVSQRGNHYSYAYPLAVERKMKYYNQIYPHMDYKTWFDECYMKWTPENKDEIESKFSIHPSCPGAKTKLFTGKHDIVWK